MSTEQELAAKVEVLTAQVAMLLRAPMLANYLRDQNLINTVKQAFDAIARLKNADPDERGALLKRMGATELKKLVELATAEEMIEIVRDLVDEARVNVLRWADPNIRVRVACAHADAKLIPDLCVLHNETQFKIEWVCNDARGSFFAGRQMQPFDTAIQIREDFEQQLATIDAIGDHLAGKRLSVREASEHESRNWFIAAVSEGVRYRLNSHYHVEPVGQEREVHTSATLTVETRKGVARVKAADQKNNGLAAEANHAAAIAATKQAAKPRAR